MGVRQIIVACALMCCASAAIAQTPVGTSFTYQGELVRNGVRVSDDCDFDFSLFDAATDGNQIGATQEEAAIGVDSGHFTVELDFGAGAFQSDVRWLEIAVACPGGSGLPSSLSPRVKVSLSPQSSYAVRAGTASYAEDADTVDGVQAAALLDKTIYDNDDDGEVDVAAAVPWQGITGRPSHVLHVSETGGDYSTIAGALAATTGASSTSRYIIVVAPGTYSESQTLTVPSYVHLRGSGTRATVIDSSQSSASHQGAAAAIVLEDHAQLSALQVINQGTTSDFAIGVYTSLTGRSTLIEDVEVIVSGSGGTGHAAVYLDDAEPTIRDSVLQAYGATGSGTAVNAALQSVNISGGFPEAFIEGSVLLGGTGDVFSCSDPTGTGYGMALSESSPIVMNAVVCGGHRAVMCLTNGTARVSDSQLLVSSTASAYLIESTASANVEVAGSLVSYAGNKYSGTGGLACIHDYKTNFTAASDGTTSGTACN